MIGFELDDALDMWPFLRAIVWNATSSFLREGIGLIALRISFLVRLTHAKHDVEHTRTWTLYGWVLSSSEIGFVPKSIETR